MTQAPPIPNVSRFREELEARRLIPTVTAGLVIGIVEVVLASSFAALIFSGDASVHVPAGIALTLFAGIVILAVTSLLSSLPVVIGSIKDNTAAGQELIRQGAPSDALYFLVSGLLTAQLRRHDGTTVRLRTMSPGTVVGEVAMYLGAASASVVGEAQSKVYRLSSRSLSDMERRDPDLAATLHRFFAKHLAQRLSEATQTMDALLD